MTLFQELSLCKWRTTLGLGSWWPWKWASLLQMKSHDVSSRGESLCCIVLSCVVKPSKSLGSNHHPTSHNYVTHQNPSAENIFQNFSSVFKVIPINCKYGRADDSYNQYVSWSWLLMHVFSVCEFFYVMPLVVLSVLAEGTRTVRHKLY
jgi:hypothetical protein